MDKNFTEYERLVAIREGNHNHDADLYFNARPKLDTKANRDLFEAGFNRAWRSYPNEPAHRQQLAKPVVEWISVKDRLPEFIEGKDISENVLGICEGKVYVFNRYFELDMEGFIWCRASSCYRGLHDAECEFDDDYEVTHWMPLPAAYDASR